MARLASDMVSAHCLITIVESTRCVAGVPIDLGWRTNIVESHAEDGLVWSFKLPEKGAGEAHELLPLAIAEALAKLPCLGQKGRDLGDGVRAHVEYDDLYLRERIE